MSGFTNRGKYRVLGVYYRAVAAPTNFYLALVTSAVAPVADINTLSELTQISAGTGYTANGQSIARNATDFDVYTEDDANDRGLIQIKNITWTASGGNMGAARYAVLTDDNATPASRDILNYWSLGSDRTVSDGQALTLVDCEIQINEA